MVESEELLDQATLEVPEYIGGYAVKQVMSLSKSTAVVAVENLKNGEQLAMKILSKSDLLNSGMLPVYERDFAMLRVHVHTNLLQIHQMFQEGSYICIVMERFDSESLDNYLHKVGDLPENTAKRIFYQLNLVVGYLHAQGICHRAISMDNILIDSENRLKLKGLGYSFQSIQPKLLTGQVGSPIFAPPEMIRNESYDGKKCDIWALGVVLYTLVCNRFPWESLNTDNSLSDILSCKYTIPSHIPTACCELIRLLLAREPVLRLSADHIMSHKWLSSREDILTYASPIVRKARRLSSHFSEVNTGIIMRPTLQKKVVTMRGSISQVGHELRPVLISQQKPITAKRRAPVLLPVPGRTQTTESVE